MNKEDEQDECVKCGTLKKKGCGIVRIEKANNVIYDGGMICGKCSDDIYNYADSVNKLITTPEVDEDGWHCSLHCPYLPQENYCDLVKSELLWHDFFIAGCANRGDE